ncbi:MAG: Serine/threonine protein kinase PrkC, regulator of stationary phase [Myxococcales bacterium]|nr:Serine/threonine protein kinase PrkC, regulator of stationary phase [Myxococcales bacterium]
MFSGACVFAYGSRMTERNDAPSGEAAPITSGLTEGDELAPFVAAGERDRYVAGKVLGAGGMGEVRSYVDRATGRSIAMKTMHAEADGIAVRRFAREARIQSQLEHPAVVPVYDVGTRDGTPYITMKHVRGESLAAVITQLRAGDVATKQRFTRRRLLTVLSSVAMTVEYAHRRGVIHRDLKPDNIMLGPFGEVYVLDWGLAAIVADHEPVLRVSQQVAAMQHPDERTSTSLLDSSPRPETETGSLLGTPGYVAPELLEPNVEPSDRSDVYALGAILFEILTFDRMNRGEGLAQVIGQSLAIDGASPREHAQQQSSAPEVPPELDALCQMATRLDPAARLPSAEALARAIEAFLDGDRDLARRRELAVRATDKAAATVATPGATLDARNAALREVTVALGLDPTNARARTLLVRLLTEPSPEAARLAEVAGRDAALRSFRLAARTHMFAQATYLLYIPLLLWMGIRSPWMFVVGASAISAVFFVTLYYHRHPPRDLQLPWFHLITSLVALTSGEVLLGPFVLVPGIVIATGVGYLASFERGGVRVIVGALAVVLVPAILQLTGVIPPSYVFGNGRIEILPMMTELPATPTAVLLLVTHAVVIASSLAFVWRLRRAYGDAERALRLQTWQLSQLVPEDARPSAVPAS